MKCIQKHFCAGTSLLAALTHLRPAFEGKACMGNPGCHLKWADGKVFIFFNYIQTVIILVISMGLWDKLVKKI